jgi:hypothetical protein
MTVTADRLSDTDVKVGDTIYSFDAKAKADAFQECLANDKPDACLKNHAPASQRAAAADTDALDVKPGGIISPSMGGMP